MFLWVLFILMILSICKDGMIRITGLDKNGNVVKLNKLYDGHDDNSIEVE